MAKTQILEYTIWLTDEALVNAYNADLAAGNGPGMLLFYYSPALQANTFGVLRAPGGTGAQIEFAAPLQLDTDPFLAPCIRSPWFTDGQNFPTDVAKFTRKSGGWFGIPDIFGETTVFYWAGKFAFSPPSVDSPPGPSPPPPPPPLRSRRWVDGFELPGYTALNSSGEGGTIGGANSTRDSSRTIDGFGCAFRSSTMAIQGRRHEVMEYRGGGTSDQDWSWERLYIRPRRYPNIEIDLWGSERINSTGSTGSEGMRLRMAPNGGLLVYSFSGVGTLQATGPVLPLDTWARLDLVVGYNSVDLITPPTTVDQFGSLRVYLDGVQIINVALASLFPNLAQNWRHWRSFIGPQAANTGEFDVDDWISVDCPTLTAYGAGGIGERIADYALLETQTDFIAGTHCQGLLPSGVVSQVNWAGAWQLALQRPVENAGSSNRLTSSTSGALLALAADVSPSYLRIGTVGVGAVVMGWYGLRGAGTPGNDTLEIELTFGSDPPITVSRSVAPPGAGTIEWRSVLYDSDAVDPAPVLSTLELRFTHGADVILRTVSALQVVAELIGVFGPEDTTDDDYPPQPPVSPHNSAYPFSPWATGGAPLFGAVAVVAGSYLSDGLPVDLEFPLPVQMLWIRRTSGTSAQMVGARWWTSLFTSHFDLTQPIIPYGVPMALRDPNFPPAPAEDDQEMQFLVRIATDDPIINAAGATYAYLAVCDPAARFVQCGASAHTSPFPITESLPDPNYTPEAGFFFPEDRGVTITARLSYKGPDHAANEASLISGTILTDYVNFAAGALSERTNFFPANTEQTAYTLFRHSDGNVGTGADATLFQTAVYVGDGVSPRTIDLTPLFGIRPVWGIVVGPTANSGRQRDTGHTGTTSTNLGTGALVAANGIQGGGIDQIIVGSDINVLGTTYYVFVIPGDDTACENGWGCPGTYYVVEPDSAFDPGWIEPEEIDPGGGDDVPAIPPIDFSNPERLRLTYIDRMVYFDYADTEGDGHTLLFEPLYKRWSLDLYPSGASVRYNEPGPLAHTNLIGCYNGQIYQFDESLRTDDGTGIPWVLWPLWAGGDDPRGLKQWGDAVVDLTPGGGCLVTPVAANGGVLAATTIAASASRGTHIIEVNTGNGIVARNFGLRIQGTQTAADPSRPFLYAWEPSWLPKDVSVERRATDWDDLGYKGAKFVQGVVIRANTFNVSKSVEVQYDGGTVAETLELLHNGEETIAYPIDPYGWQPFIAELVRLKGADAVPWSLLDWRWVWEPAPEAATQWETQETTFNLPGFLAVHDCVIAYMADDPVTLTVWHDTGLQMHTLPATGGAYLRYYQRLSAAKGKWARFRLTSDSPFRLFARDTSIRVQGWGLSGGFQVVQPFGGPHREVGAQI